jgi:hypothetical protein
VAKSSVQVDLWNTAEPEAFAVLVAAHLSVPRVGASVSFNIMLIGPVAPRSLVDS